MGPLITPVMIVRDEETFLPDALASLTALRPILARTCIYDTGSIDATIDIAQHAGASVRRGFWDDDFARAKNEAVGMSRSDWVLSLDADERVVGDPALLSAALRAAEAKGLDAVVIDVEDVQGGQILTVAPSVRLFRSSRARFRNRIHEVVTRRDGSPLRAARIPRDALHLRHVGYGPEEAMARRKARNSRIGDLEVAAARQGDDRVRLVEALVNRGRSRSIGGHWAQGIQDWSEARASSADTPFRLYASELLARAYVEVGQVAEAAAVLRDLRAQGSDSNLVAWLTARAFVLAGRPHQTVQALRDIAQPVSALGERHPLAPLLEIRMLAAAETGEIDLAVDDAIQLMAEHRVHGYARLLLLMWGAGSTEALAERLAVAGHEHLVRIAAEFQALGEQGSPMVLALHGFVGEFTPETPSTVAPTVGWTKNSQQNPSGRPNNDDERVVGGKVLRQ